MIEFSRFDKEYEQLATKVKRLTSALEVAKRTLEAFEIVRQAFEPEQKYRRPSRVKLNVSADELRGKPLLEAILLIAVKNGGFFNVSQARLILIEADILSSKQSGSNQLWKEIKESGKFESVKRGMYRLIMVRKHENETE